MSESSLAPVLRFVLAERGWDHDVDLETLSALLPAIACAGMEMPLGGDGPIDLQQRIRTGAEVDQLARHLRLTSTLLDSPWQRVLHFCQEELLTGQIEDVWLELDAVGLSEAPPLSVFVRLPATLSRPSLWPAVARILTSPGCEPSATRRGALLAALEACPPASRVSHLGLMLGRPEMPVRMVIEGIDGFDDLLTRAGLPGSAESVQQWADTLFAYVDRIRLALTVTERLQPTVGLECFLGGINGSDPRWPCALDLLVRKGLCRPERRDGILQWPAVLTPDSATGDWPHLLVLEALARSPKEIGWLECRISHVKITVSPDGKATAKAYIGFVGTWADVTEAATAAAPIAHDNSNSPSSISLDALDKAIERTLDFLLAARTQAGLWLDYEGFQEGVSDEWVSAYAANALAESRDEQAIAAARRAWARLAQRNRTGWGWNGVQPADADSTLWALCLAERLGVLDSKEAQAALVFLRQHLLPDGGVTTYGPDSRCERPAGMAINAAWHAAHGCVTAAAASFAPLGPAPLDFLRRTQQPDGCWTGYWWKSPVYATAHAAEALAERGTAADGERVSRAVRWTKNALRTSPSPVDPAVSPFAGALALRLLLLEPLREQTVTTAQRLLATQNADGSWPASALLAIPNARGEEVPALDKRMILTTATVLRTLTRLRSALAKSAGKLLPN